MILPFDPTELLRRKLVASRRPSDGKLHPSGDLVGSLRHTQLHHVGAPTLSSDLVSDVRLMIGTDIHTSFEQIFRGLPVMLEVKLDDYMPTGWSGTADWIVWDTARRAFILGDLKSQKPEGMHYVLKDGMKQEHLWQVSAYWWALVRMGLPLLNGFCVYYLPTNQLLARDGVPVEPSLQEGTPLPREVVEGRMEERWAAAEAYRLARIEKCRELGAAGHGKPLDMLEAYLLPELAPVQERVPAVHLNKQLKRPVLDVKLVPHWSTEFCPFPSELCNCREQGPNKVGHWDRNEAGHLVYVPREKDGQVMPQPATVPQPDADLIKKLVKAQEEANA